MKRPEFDLQLAHTNIGGELLDLQAVGELASDIDPAVSADRLLEHYRGLRRELTQDEVVAADEQYRIDERIERLNQLGFDVEEMEVETLDDGQRLKMTVRVVEPGYHKHRLERLTGLVVEENQARRLLNDMQQFSAWYQQQPGMKKLARGMIAYLWYNQVYLPAVQAIPDEYKQQMDEAEISHQLLEHRWYMSERAGVDVGLDVTIQSYIETVLKPGLERLKTNPVPMENSTED